MGIHPTLPAGSAEQIRDRIVVALTHMFPLNSVRRDVPKDTIIIEDDSGGEWSLLVEKLD